jgi:hypothetical protein
MVAASGAKPLKNPMSIKNTKGLVREMLSALPSSSLPSAITFRKMVDRGLSVEAKWIQSIKAGLVFGEEAFHAWANVAIGEYHPAQFRAEAFEFISTLGLEAPWIKRIVRNWLSKSQRELFFGVDCGTHFDRRNLIFKFRPFALREDMNWLLSNLETPANLAKSLNNLNINGLKIDLEKNEPIAFKFYSIVNSDYRKDHPAAERLLSFVQSEGIDSDLCPMIVRRGFDASGRSIGEAFYVWIDSDPLSDSAALASRYARFCGLGEEAEWLEKAAQRNIVVPCLGIATDAEGRIVDPEVDITMAGSLEQGHAF